LETIIESFHELSHGSSHVIVELFDFGIHLFHPGLSLLYLRFSLLNVFVELLAVLFLSALRLDVHALGFGG